MKLLHTEITPLTNQVSSVELRHQRFLQSPYFSKPVFHEHPEYELVYILEGYGKRIVGEMAERFEAGDMVFIGSNVPHVWLSDEEFYKKGSSLESKVIVSYLNPNKFTGIFDSIEEFGNIKQMLTKASRGIKIYGETRIKIAEKLLDLLDKDGFERLHGILHIMHMIAESEEIEYVTKTGILDADFQNCDRLIQVINYIKENLHNQITLREVSKIAYMTEQSFCRFFRNRTKKSFSQYLIEQRISHARNLLIQTDKPISDIAYLCGYLSSSHFCKVFKSQIKQSPYQYKRNIMKIAV